MPNPNDFHKYLKEYFELGSRLAVWFQDPNEFLKPGEWDMASTEIQAKLKELPLVISQLKNTFALFDGDGVSVMDKTKGAAVIHKTLRSEVPRMKVSSVKSASEADFWDNLLKNSSGGGTGSIDTHLSGQSIAGGDFQQMRQLADSQKVGLQLPIAAGTRVAFVGSLGSVMTYSDPPVPKSFGTVVTVRTATGDVTAHGGNVFVEWDDGKFRPIHASHLSLAKGVRKASVSKSRMRVASMGDLTEFMKMGSEGTLIHKSTRDLWSVHQDQEGFVIERLFDDVGKPLKA